MPRGEVIRKRRVATAEAEEHIAWLRSFKMSDESIARELGISVDALLRRSYPRSREKQDA